MVMCPSVTAVFVLDGHQINKVRAASLFQFDMKISIPLSHLAAYCIDFQRAGGNFRHPRFRRKESGTDPRPAVDIYSVDVQKAFLFKNALVVIVPLRFSSITELVGPLGLRSNLVKTRRHYI